MTKFYLTEDDVERVGEGLIDRSLPKPEWTHAAHFAAALWLLRHRTDLVIGEAMPRLIRAYNVATGVANTDTSGYHETITMASIAAAQAYLAKQPARRALHEAIDELMATPFGRSEWLLAYWTQARLFSAEARRRWAPPDLRAFDPGALFRT